MNNPLKTQVALRFWASAIFAIHRTEPLPVAAAVYSILRAGVRLFGYALPGQCTNAAINLSLATGTCSPVGATWLLTRVSWDTSAHAWSWVMYGAFALLIALWKRPPGSFNGWLAFMLVGFAVAVHELYWFFTYWVVHPYSGPVILDPNIGYGSFVAMMFIGLAIFYLAGFHRQLDMRALFWGMVVFTLFMAGWASAGYPQSLDLILGDKSPFFGSGWVDSIEFTSWLFMFTVVGVAYYVKQLKQAR